MFNALNVDLSTAFYKYRFLSDSTKKVVLPLKGTPEKVMNGEVDKKTKGPFLIKLCLNSACMPAIAFDPILLSL